MDSCNWALSCKHFTQQLPPKEATLLCTHAPILLLVSPSLVLVWESAGSPGEEDWETAPTIASCFLKIFLVGWFSERKIGPDVYARHNIYNEHIPSISFVLSGVPVCLRAYYIVFIISLPARHSCDKAQVWNSIHLFTVIRGNYCNWLTTSEDHFRESSWKAQAMKGHF